MGSFVLPVPAPLLFLDGSLQRRRQPSLQQSVPVGQGLLLTQVFFSPIKHRRFVGGLGQVSAVKNNSNLRSQLNVEK